MAILGLSIALISCGSHNDDQWPATFIAEGIFEDFFEAKRTLLLQEPADTVLGRPQVVRPHPGGGVVILDAMNSQIRIHQDDGRLERLIGRSGSGPGEFRAPFDVWVGDEGDLQVVEAEGARLSRFDHRGELLDVTNLPTAGVRVVGRNDRTIVGLQDVTGTRFGFLGEDGSIAPFYEWPPEIVRNRYWPSIAMDHLAVGERAILVASSLRYPMWRYTIDGSERTEFGHPPASWRKPMPMPPGPQDPQQTAQSLETFDIIAGIHALTSGHVLVSHGRYDPAPEGGMRALLRTYPYGVDIYDAEGVKVAEDLPLPGRIMHADSLVYVLTGEPGTGWEITLFRPRI